MHSLRGHTMDSVIVQSFSVNLRVMQTLRLYLPDTSAHSNKIKIYIMYFLITLPVPSLGILYIFLEDNIDMKRVADNAFLLAEVTCYVTKLLPFIRNSDQIRRCIHYFEFPIFMGLNQKQVKIIDKCIKISRRNCTVFLVFMVAGTISWATKPMIAKFDRLPVDVWLPFDPTAGPVVYWVVYLLLVAGVSYPAAASAVIDPLIGGLACLATGQLTVLKDNLEHLCEYAEQETKDEKAKFNIIYDKIKRCIDHHEAILDFIKEYEKSFSWVVFSQFTGSIFVLCFCCLQLVLVEPLSFDFFTMVSYSNVLLVQIYFYCYYGTTLFEESNTLTNAVYMGKWYEYDVKSRKALITFMERAKRPIIVTSGKILDLSLTTFTMILRRSYSLLAVLRNYK